MGRFVMVSGKVVRFDEVRGYGFVAPEGGGEDVFIHVNDLTFDKRLLTPGTLVEFTVEEGDRGPKASHVRMLGSPEPSRPMDNELGDVLSTKKFIGEVTETLLSAAPTMSAQQILQARQGLVVKARGPGRGEARRATAVGGDRPSCRHPAALLTRCVPMVFLWHGRRG